MLQVNSPVTERHLPSVGQHPLLGLAARPNIAQLQSGSGTHPDPSIDIAKVSILRWRIVRSRYHQMVGGAYYPFCQHLYFRFSHCQTLCTETKTLAYIALIICHLLLWLGITISCNSQEPFGSQPCDDDRR